MCVFLLLTVLIVLTTVVWGQETSIVNDTLNNPYGITEGNEGDIILVDSFNNQIKRIEGNNITTIAGIIEGYDSWGFPLGGYVDGSNALARFNKPRGVVVDSNNNLFVADTDNHAIRKISEGQIYTFAGTGKAGCKDGKGNVAQFNSPSGIIIDKNDNIYVTDTLNNIIRKITPQGQVSTYAGKTEGGFKDGSTGIALFNEPSGIDIDANGNLYVVDSGNQLIRKISQDQVSTIMGTKDGIISGTDYAQGGLKNGLALEAKLNFPRDIEVTENGSIFIADTWNHRIRVMTPTGDVRTIANLGVGGYPVGLLYQEGTLYITDTGSNTFRSIQVNSGQLELIIDYEPLSEKIQVWVEGEKLSLSETNETFIDDGKTMLPLRIVCETLGANVEWYQDGRIVVSRGKLQKELLPGRDPLVLKNDITMVHLRYLAESLGFSVKWVPEYRAVTVLANSENTGVR